MTKATVAAALAMVALAGGCQRGDPLGVMDSIHRAVARHEAGRGCELAAGGDEGGAAAAFEKAVSHDPHNALAQANLGRIHAAAGRYEPAVRHFQAAVRSAPDCTEYAFALATCLDKLADTSIDRQRTLEAAVRAYRHVRWLDPHNLEAAIRLGVCLRRSGNYSEAITALREAQSLDHDSAAVHVELAATCEELGDHANALSEYAAALKLDPDNLAAHNATAEINLTLSRQSPDQHPLAERQAIAHLRKSLQIEANQPRIQALLTRLEPSAAKMAAAGE